PLVPATAMEQINTQYWVASILNAEEAFANWRRSGYPVLTPNPYPQSGIEGDFIRRMDYSVSEYTNNLENITAAINRQGPDKLDTRVWWDVE
ncbi:MAG: SusD/RagB family nutrient-binding outer membrane lipoprotein, partial [Cyclobacteriaceae bacterium]